MFRHKPVGAISILAVGALLLSGCGGGSGEDSSALTKVTLTVGVPSPDPVTAFLEAGISKGYFKANGVDLHLAYTQGSVTATSLVQSGQADAGLAGPEQLPSANQQGADLVAIYQHAYSPIFPVAYLDGSKYQSIQSLKGARIGVLSHASGAVPVLQAILQGAGLSLNDVHLVPIGFGAQAVAAVKAGSVDFLAYYDSGYALMENQGVKLRTYQDPSLTNKYPGQVIFTSQKTLSDRGTALVGMLRGMTKSIKYCTSQPTDCIDAFAAAVEGGVSDKSVATSEWKARAAIMQPPAEAKGLFGYTSDSYWQSLLRVQLEGGVIKKTMPASSLFTTKLTADANGPT